MPKPISDQAGSPRAILLTNIMLTRRTGAEVVTDQLADGLRRRGHDVMVFTPQAGPLEMQMRARGHVVVTDPAALPRLHGPGVPARDYVFNWVFLPC